MDRLQKGFTLVELLIVIVIISILAAIAIPQFLGSTQDANESTLKADLTALRNAIELYYHQHNDQTGGEDSKYPGGNATGEGPVETAFLAQLTNYSNSYGTTSSTLDRDTYPYGPYLKTGMPDNPLPNTTALMDAAGLDIQLTGAALTADDAAADGWAYDVMSGAIIANNSDYEDW